MRLLYFFAAIFGEFQCVSARKDGSDNCSAAASRVHAATLIARGGGSSRPTHSEEPVQPWEWVAGQGSRFIQFNNDRVEEGARGSRPSFEAEKAHYRDYVKATLGHAPSPSPSLVDNLSDDFSFGSPSSSLTHARHAVSAPSTPAARQASPRARPYAVSAPSSVRSSPGHSPHM